MALYREVRRAELAARTADFISEAAYKRIYMRLKEASNASSVDDIIEAWGQLAGKGASLKEQVADAEQRKMDFDEEKHVLYKMTANISKLYTPVEALLEQQSGAKPELEGLEGFEKNLQFWYLVDQKRMDIMVRLRDNVTINAATHDLEHMAMVLGETMRGKLLWMLMRWKRVELTTTQHPLRKTNSKASVPGDRTPPRRGDTTPSRRGPSPSPPRAATAKAAKFKLKAAMKMGGFSKAGQAGPPNRAGGGGRRKKALAGVKKLAALRAKAGIEHGLESGFDRVVSQLDRSICPNAHSALISPWGGCD